MQSLTYDLNDINSEPHRYYRVSTNGQSIEAQKAALPHAKLIEREFMDEGVSGSIPATDRPGFAAMVDYVREGDTIHVYAVDRLGRDAIDIQTIRALLKKRRADNAASISQAAAHFKLSDSTVKRYCAA